MKLTELFQHETDLLSISSGQALFREGHPREAMYVLMSGTADIMLGQRIVEYATPGAIFGELSMVDESPHSATVIATSDCRFVTITQKRFTFLIQQTPKFALHVMQVMANRLRNTNRLLQV